MEYDWIHVDEDDFPRDYEDRYQIEAAADGGVDAEGWERYTVVEQRYRALEGGSITSWDSLPEADSVLPPAHRALSAFKWLRPHSPHGLSSVPLALRYARLRFTQGWVINHAFDLKRQLTVHRLSAGVRSIRKYLPTSIHVPLLRTTRRTSSTLDRRVIPEWHTDAPTTNTTPALRHPHG